MDFPDLFAAIDVKPFRPFKIELVSGRQIDVTHPDNIMIAPTRQRVICIHVYQTDPYADLARGARRDPLSHCRSAPCLLGFGCEETA